MAPNNAADAYTASDLVHLVGSKDPDDHDGNWRTLKAILESGEITTGGLRAAAPSTIEGVRWSALSRETRKPLSSNERYRASVACFADIPERLLGVHTGKYGRFGLALSKHHLLSHGVRPVLYVPRGADTGVFAGCPTVEDDWDEVVPLIEDGVMRRFGGHAGGATPEQQRRIENWIEFAILAYVKFFDPTLDDENPSNFYMEREWRSTTAVPFDLAQVMTLYVAEGWRDRAEDYFAGNVVVLK